jgi:hypothetical protein
MSVTRRNLTQPGTRHTIFADSIIQAIEAGLRQQAIGRQRIDIRKLKPGVVVFNIQPQSFDLPGFKSGRAVRLIAK